MVIRPGAGIHVITLRNARSKSECLVSKAAKHADVCRVEPLSMLVSALEPRHPRLGWMAVRAILAWQVLALCR